MTNGRCRHPICPEAKAEVAREIFEEIEDEIKRRILVVEGLAEESDNEEYYTGCADSCYRIVGFILDLKKKYMEGAKND